MPKAEEWLKLKSLVDFLAGLSLSPKFSPHCTLLPGLRGALESMQSTGAELAQDAAPFTVRIERVECGATFFRAQYLLPEPVPLFFSLREKAINLLSHQPHDLFMPHVSLLYAEIPDFLKDEQLGQFPHSLPESLTFDRIALVKTSGPVESWKTISAWELCGKD